ncbi:MAG: hypothetical protein PHS14_06475 [Elusimicrobia bacterium]|nr:hypothetical protein [Elusimicrobiota bacterium]
MLSGDELKGILKQLEKRLEKLEAAVFTAAPRVDVPTTKRTLPDHILELRDKGFFSKPQTSTDVHEALNDTYPSEFDRVAMALIRLADRKELRRLTKTVDGKKYKAFAR